MRELSLQMLLPELLKELSAGKEVTLSGTGRSMYPFIDESRDRVVLSSVPAGELTLGNVYLFQRASGGYVIHRLCRIAPDGSLTFLGDRQSKPETGIQRQQVLARVTHILRDGSQKISFTDGRQYRKAVRSMRFRLQFPGHQRRMAVISDSFAAVRSKIRHLFK